MASIEYSSLCSGFSSSFGTSAEWSGPLLQNSTGIVKETVEVFYIRPCSSDVCRSVEEREDKVEKPPTLN